MIGYWLLADPFLALQVSGGEGRTAYRFVVMSHLFGTLLEGEWVSVPA